LEIALIESSKPQSRLTRSRGFYAALLLSVIVVAAVQLNAYYDFQKFILNNRGTGNSSGDHSGNSTGSGKVSGSGNSSIPNPNYIGVNTLVSYGNGTIKWYNETQVPKIWNFYNLTIFLANGNVETKYYPILGEHYILAINGLKQVDPLAWSLWIFCQRDRAWEQSPVGADEIILANGETLAWYYQSYAQQAQPPVAGAPQVALCSS
jgi:hypothetical protein